MKILITGTTSGIGKSILKLLLGDNNRITIINRRSTKNLAKNVKELICDLSNIEEVESICKIISNTEFDALINNAGGGTPSEFTNISIQDIKKEINVNFISPMLLIQAVIENMKKRGFGKIINISSISGKEGTPFLFTYSASKSALNSLTQSLAKIYTKYGVFINTISPGGIDTDMSIKGRKKISKLYNLDETEYQNKMLQQMGLNKLIKPDVVANIVKLMLSRDFNSISGQNINICGALELR